MSQIEHQVPRRYARALFDAARGKGIVDAISEELAAVRSTIATDNALIDFLDAPQVTDKDKFQLIDEVFKDNFSEVVYSFFRLTVEKRRSKYTLAIIDEFTSLAEKEKGIIRAQVTTATPMELDQRDKLADKLAKMTGKTVHVYPKVDEKIIGGVVVNMNNQVLDDSVRNKLNAIRNRLLALKMH